MVPFLYTCSTVHMDMATGLASINLVTLVTFLALTLNCHASAGAGGWSFIEPHRLEDLQVLLPDPMANALSWQDVCRLEGSGRRELLGSAVSRMRLTETDSRPGGTKGGRARHCVLTKGDWCTRFEHQEPIPFQPAPRGAIDCPNDCNGVGSCNYDTGRCQCPAGWTGDDCTTPQKRPCTNRWRGQGKVPTSYIDEDGHDLNWTEPGWTASRCAGICDDNIGFCYCKGSSPYGIQSFKGKATVAGRSYGRHLGSHCKPSTDAEGKKISWGTRTYIELYGTDGWCSATPKPELQCGCMLDGHNGRFCDEFSTAFCINQCSGHGQCDLGFCKCDPGWYGTDCSRKKAGLEIEPPRWDRNESHLAAAAVQPPAAADAPASTTRRRPLIYIYDLPTDFNVRLHQYRIGQKACVYRLWNAQNESYIQGSGVYDLETYFHETLAQSEFRTYDPEEADFFFVPHFISCYFWPVHGWADHPWWGAPTGLRVMHGSNFIKDLYSWIRQNHPWWDRRQGRDHIWLALQDEGACWFPTEVYNASIILTHWGRMDADHQSGTAYAGDNYTAPFTHPEFQPVDWRNNWQGHPCFTPGKNLVVPSFKSANHISGSPLLGAAPAKEKDILLFFRGDVGKRRLPNYSRGIRQKLYQLAKEHDWGTKYNIKIGDQSDVPGSYSDLISRSKFCLVVPGDGWSARAEDAVLHGCVPVIIMDNVQAVYESVLEYDLFAVRIREASIPYVPNILQAITDQQYARMQKRLTRVWHRFLYASGRLQRATVQKELQQNHARHQQQPEANSPHFPYHSDAFHTIMQWLYGRIEATRGQNTHS